MGQEQDLIVSEVRHGLMCWTPAISLSPVQPNCIGAV